MSTKKPKGNTAVVDSPVISDIPQTSDIDSELEAALAEQNDDTVVAATPAPAKAEKAPKAPKAPKEPKPPAEPKARVPKIEAVGFRGEKNQPFTRVFRSKAAFESWEKRKNKDAIVVRTTAIRELSPEEE